MAAMLSILKIYFKDLFKTDRPAASSFRLMKQNKTKKKKKKKNQQKNNNKKNNNKKKTKKKKTVKTDMFKV